MIRRSQQTIQLECNILLAPGSKPERLQKLIADFDAEITGLLAHVPQLLSDGDMPALAADVHKSIGSAGMIGVHHFQSALRGLEQAAKAANVESANKHADLVTAAWPATQSALQAKSYTLG